MAHLLKHKQELSKKKKKISFCLCKAKTKAQRATRKQKRTYQKQIKKPSNYNIGPKKSIKNKQAQAGLEKI
jgi:hypothetical protein